MSKKKRQERGMGREKGGKQGQEVGEKQGQTPAD